MTTKTRLKRKTRKTNLNCQRPIFHYVNGKFVLQSQAQISAFDLGLIRGYGIFDYVQLYEGRPFHLTDHLDRLQWSADQVGLSLPMTIQEINEIVHVLIKKNDPINAGIRLIVTGGISTKDQLLPVDTSNLTILFHPFNPLPEKYYSEGMRVITSEILRLFPSVKSTNYMPAILSMKKAQKQQFDDALYLNDRKEILEGTTSNAFFLKNGVWITDDSNMIVKGITRKILLGLIKNQYPIEFRSIHLSEVESCEEAFLCSSVKDVVPLVQIDNIKIGSGMPGPQTANIRRIYREYIQKYLSQEFMS